MPRKRRIMLTSIRPQGSIVFAYRMVNRPRREGDFYAGKGRREKRGRSDLCRGQDRPPSFARGFSRHLRFDTSYPRRYNDSSDRRKVDSRLRIRRGGYCNAGKKGSSLILPRVCWGLATKSSMSNPPLTDSTK